MTNPRFDDPLKELEAALAIEPSPAFAAGVRARIAETGGRSTWPAWQGMAAAAAVAVTVLGGIVWRAGQVPAQSVREGTPTPAAVVANVAPDTGAAPAPVTNPRSPVEARVAASRSRVSAAPEVIVPTDQAVALNRWMAALQERKTAARHSAEVPLVVIEELPKINPLQIEPVRIDWLVPNSPPSGGKEKDR